MCIRFLKRREKSLKSVLERIEQADDFEISEIIQAVIRRYDKFFPDWEVSFLSVHKDPELREKELEETIQYLKRTAPTAHIDKKDSLI